MIDDVGHIAMNEHLSGSQSQNLVRGHTTVRAANPKILWRLNIHQLLEKVGFLTRHLLRPVPIGFEKAFETHA
jgi:hypothetical protein